MGPAVSTPSQWKKTMKDVSESGNCLPEFWLHLHTVFLWRVLSVSQYTILISIAILEGNRLFRIHSVVEQHHQTPTKNIKLGIFQKLKVAEQPNYCFGILKNMDMVPLLPVKGGSLNLTYPGSTKHDYKKHMQCCWTSVVNNKVIGN